MKLNLARESTSKSSVVPESACIVLAVATDRDREAIYCHRHEIYALELGQHQLNSTQRLHDTLDDWNLYLVAKVNGEIAGFVSVTPPGRPAYSIDKYFERASLPFAIDEKLFEVRLLTVLKPYRGREV